MQKIEYSLSSLEVAEMLEIEHWKLLRKLEGNKKSKGIITILTDNNFVVGDFFISNTYKDSSGKKNKCYKVTKKGCEFLANKFTGEKGVIFTARYINRFHEMESILSKQKQEVAPVQPEQIGQITKECADLRQEINNLKADMRRINRIQMLSYGSSHTYKAEIIRMLEGLWEEEDKDKKFLCQIYTIIKTYTKRKYQYSCLTHNMN